MNEYIKKTENLLKNYTKYMAIIKDDSLDSRERKHIAIQLKKLNNALEILTDRDRYVIEEYYIKKNQLKNISKVVNLEESYLSSYKKKIIRNLTSIIFVGEMCCEEKLQI